MNRNRFSVNVFKYRMALSIILTAVLFLPVFALADAISDVAFDQQNPHTIYITSNSNPDKVKGLWFVTWEDWRDRFTSGANIYGQFIDNKGAFCGDEFVISNSGGGKSPGNQTVPRAAYRTVDGKIVVVWQDTRSRYVYYNTITGVDFTCATPPVVGTERQIGYNAIEEFTYPPLNHVTNEVIGTGNGVTSTFSNVLSHNFIDPGTVTIVAATFFDTDNGSGGFAASEGSINYATGAIDITLADSFVPTPGTPVYASYSYFTSWPPNLTSVNDQLLARMHPRIAYDQSADRFLVVWKETRSTLHRLSQLVFYGLIDEWVFDDSDFIGYVRLRGDTLSELNSDLGVAGADIIRNSETTTVRLLSASLLALEEIREYESFNLATNPDVACDDTSTQCFIVSEGVREKLTETCTCEDKNGNGGCNPFEPIACELAEAPYDDGFVHIYGLSDNYITLPTVSSMKLDSATGFNAHYPSLGFDPITKRFLAAWEDFRGGANTKIFGQLILSGGGRYNDDFIISYQDTDNDGANDPNVLNSKQTKPFVSYDGVNQRFFVAWQDGRNSSLSLENLDIYGQKIDTEGTLRGFNFPILTEPGSQLNPTIAYNYLKDRFLAVWKDARNADDSTCSTTGGSGTGAKPCGSDVFDQIFTLEKSSITLLNMDDTALSPPLLDCFEDILNPGVCLSPVSVGQSATQSFKVKNTGDKMLKIDDIKVNLDCNGAPGPSRGISPFQFDGLPEELTPPADGETLDLVPGASIALTVRFKPNEGGSFNKCFIIQSDGGNPQVNLSALAIEQTFTGPVLSAKPSPVNFPDTLVGDTSQKAIKVTNKGTENLIITGLVNPEGEFTITGSNCIKTLHPKVDGVCTNPPCECTTHVAFMPSTGGFKQSSFGITSNDPVFPTATIIMNGTGTVPPATPILSVSPSSGDFGGVVVGGEQSIVFTVTNKGTADLAITKVSTPGLPFSKTDTCTGATLAPSTGSCLITVTFSPTASVASTSKIVISSNAGTFKVPLSGEGLAKPVISISPHRIAFGQQVVGTTSAAKTVKVTNNGAAGSSLIISEISITNPFKIISDTCLGAALGSGMSCKVKIVFNPTAFMTYSPYALIFNSNDPVNPAAQKVTLSGTGIH